MRFAKARRDRMILKLELKKVYDKLEWRFVDEMLVDASIPIKLIWVVMCMLQSSLCKLLWNGEEIESFKPTRGL